MTVFYPLFGVYPHELVFRAFLFERYGPVFGSWVSAVLSAAGGWIFATRYRRTRSLLAASVEHALYGLLVFTVGLGQFLHGAAVR